MKLEGMKVTVVGGAIGGASAALALARCGAQVTMFEREARARPVGAGIALAENGIAVLDALGLGAVMRAASCELAGVRVTDGKGRVLFTPSSHEPGRAPRARMARRSALYAALADAIARTPNIDARYGESCESLGDADLWIAADGVHSRMRERAGFEAHVRKSGIAYGRALAPAGLAQNEEAWTHAGLFGSFAVPDGTYFYMSLGTASARDAIARRDLDALRAAWARAYPASEPLLAALPSFDALLVNDVMEVRCPRYVRGNIALLGDAAHAMAPNLGQGANAALVDAAVLCAELQRADSVEAALLAYDARRRPRVQRVATTAARLGRLAELTNPALRWLRDRVLMPLAARGDGQAAARMALQEDPRQLAI